MEINVFWILLNISSSFLRIYQLHRVENISIQQISKSAAPAICKNKKLKELMWLPQWTKQQNTICWTQKDLFMFSDLLTFYFLT